MKITQLIVLMMVLTTLVVGCITIETGSGGEGTEGEATEPEDTGIGDIFEDTEEINPPEIPG